MKRFNSTHLAAFLLPALSVVFGLQSVRALLPYLQYILSDRFGWSVIFLGLVGLIIFGAGFLLNRLILWWGLRRMLLVTAGGLGLTRLAAQAWTGDALGDLLLVAGGTILFVLFLAAYLALTQCQPEPVSTGYRYALAILLGLIFDTALHGSFLTYDVIWRTGVIPLGLILALVLVQWMCLRTSLIAIPAHPALLEGSLAITLPWTAIGPFLFLQLIIFQNQARLMTLTGWSLSIVLGWVLISHLVGLVLAGRWQPGRQGVIMLSLVLVLALWPLERIHAIFFALSLSAGQLAASVLLVTMIRGLGENRVRSTTASLSQQRTVGLPAITLNHGIGMVMLVVFIFAYYAVFSLPLPYQNGWLPSLAGLIIGLSAMRVAGRSSQMSFPKVAAPALAPLVILLGLPILVQFGSPAPFPAKTSSAPLRIMTYNVHNGFNTNGQLGLEALAQVIEAEQPDVVALQEVSRGWVVNGSVDMLDWLSRRLRLPYHHFSPASDSLWGHAVFSRYPIQLAEDHPLPPRNLPLKRGFAYLQIETGQPSPLYFINTHLHHVEADSAIRVTQVAAILEFLADRKTNNELPTVILTGDFNAQPDAPEIRLLYDYGFRDAVIDTRTTPGLTFYSLKPTIRLDYIFISPNQTVTEVDIPASNASDHLGIAATIIQN